MDPFFVPSMAADICYPKSTKEDDAHKGKWVRVERNLKEQLSLKSLVSVTVYSASRLKLIFCRMCTTVGREGTISLL